MLASLQVFRFFCLQYSKQLWRNDVEFVKMISTYAYLPESSQGNWNVGVVSIGCTSRIADADCEYTGNFIAPTVTIQVPQTQPVTFVYDPTRPGPTGE